MPEMYSTEVRVQLEELLLRHSLLGLQVSLREIPMYAML